MDALDLVITTAGLDALVDAQNGTTDPIRIAQIGLTETAFDAAPTLVALPGEIARVDAVHGLAVAANVLHMSATDASAAIYDLRGFGLYLADGTLFATYGQADALFRKVSIASFLLAFDVKFSGDVADAITFGDANFTYPPASETIRGTARIATQARVDAEADAGDDGETIVTPKTLRARLAAFFAQVLAGTSNDVALTPASLGPVGGTFGTFGFARLPGGLIVQWGTVSMGAAEYERSVTLPLTFPAATLNVVASYASYPANADDESDEHLWATPAGPGAVTIHGYSGDDYGPRTVSFLAIGY